MSDKKRWNIAIGIESQYPIVDSFLKEVELLSEKYGLSLSHEDYHGNFIVTARDPELSSWLSSANVDLTIEQLTTLLQNNQKFKKYEPNRNVEPPPFQIVSEGYNPF